MEDEDIQKRIESAKVLRTQLKLNQRVGVDDAGNIVISESQSMRDIHEIRQNLKKKPLSKMAKKRVGKHHETQKNNRFSRDMDYG